MKSNKFTIIAVIVSLVLILTGSALAMRSYSQKGEPKTHSHYSERTDKQRKGKISKTSDFSTDKGKDSNTNPSKCDSKNKSFIGNDFNLEDLYYVKISDELPSQTKHYTGFYVSFNKDNHTPNYVSWQLLSSETEGTVPRAKNFWQDKTVEGCPDGNAYKNSGFDRGHMCPAADQKWSETSMNDCFVMANICPQAPGLNQKAWETLEEKERNWAKRDGDIWIVCGPIYDENDTQTIGPYEVRVPGAFFKAFLYLDGDNSRAIAFVYPNAVAPGNMEEYAMSIDDLEKITNYDFFYALPDDIENKVEATYSFTEWNKSK